MKPTNISRRGFLNLLGSGSAAALVVGAGLRTAPVAAAPVAQASTSAGFALPPLPYAYNALEPFIDTATMELHHQRHHGAAVNNLNNALKDYPDLRQREISDLLANISQLPEAVRGGVRNAGGSHLNHMVYWATMGPGGGGQPNGALAQAIGSTFGSFDAFKQQLTDLSLRIFGSGWGWLVLDRTGKLQLLSRPNQDAPVMDGFNVIVGIDMWEHAHYLKYQHRRADYVAAWFSVINWESVGKRFDAASQALGGGR